jgi:hypothetical protein
MQALPADQAAADKWTLDNADALHKIEKESQAALELLKSTAGKYGLDNLNLE